LSVNFSWYIVTESQKVEKVLTIFRVNRIEKWGSFYFSKVSPPFRGILLEKSLASAYEMLFMPKRVVWEKRIKLRLVFWIFRLKWSLGLLKKIT